MTRSCLNTYIQDIQCRFRKFAHDTSKALGTYRGDLDCKIRDTRILSSYIRSLYYYVPFEQDVTYAYKFKIDRTDSKQITIEIDIAGVVFSHTGSGDGENFAVALYNNVNGSTQSPDYKAEFNENVLYIYSYDTNASFNFNTVVNVIQGSEQTNSVSKENLENDLGEILDSWNCLKNKELCKIIDHSYDLMPEPC